MPTGIPNRPKTGEMGIDAVSIEPQVILDKEEFINIFIDPEMVGKTGIRINGKLYIGHLKVKKSLADELLRIQEEYWETVKKLSDKDVSVRMKNDFQKETLFLADPNENAGKKGFTRDYGLLGLREWSFLNDNFKQQLLDTRKQLYGY